MRTRTDPAEPRPARPRLGAVLAALALGLALAGCAVDKGSALAADFAADWADVPDVADVASEGQNTLPFLGTASGTLILDDGTPVERVAELAAELRDYLADREDVTGLIRADGVAFPVLASEDRTDTLLALWESIAADDRVIEGDIAMERADRWEVDVVATDAPAALAVFASLTAHGEPYRPLPWATALTLTAWTDFDAPATARSLSIATGDDGALPTEAIAAYESVADAYPITEAFLGPDSATLRMTRHADLATAETLARTAAPGLGDALIVEAAR